MLKGVESMRFIQPKFISYGCFAVALLMLSPVASAQSGGEEINPKWTIDFSIGNRFSQKGITFAGDPNELVIPEQKALFDENIQFDTAVGYHLTRNWHVSLAMNYYQGNIDNYGVLGDPNGSLFQFGSTYVQFQDSSDLYVCNPLHVDYNPSECPLLQKSDGDEFISQNNLGEITEIPVFARVTYNFRPKMKLRPYLGGGFGYTSMSFKKGDVNEKIAQSRYGEVGGSPLLDTCPPGDLLCLGGDPFSSVNNCVSGSQCFIQPPAISVEVKDGMNFEMMAGFNLAFKKKWTINALATYVWTDSQIDVIVSQPQVSASDTCLFYTTTGLSTTSVSGNDPCLASFDDPDALWMKKMTVLPNGNTKPEYSQFKGGAIQAERWELWLGLRYYLGQKGERAASGGES